MTARRVSKRLRSLSPVELDVIYNWIDSKSFPIVSLTVSLHSIRTSAASMDSRSFCR